MSSYHLKLGFWTEMSPPGSEKCSFRTCFCTETIKYVNRCAAYRKENAVISEHVQCILMSTYGKLHIEASAIWVNASLPGFFVCFKNSRIHFGAGFGEGTTWRSRCSHLKKNTQLISLVTIHDKSSPQWSTAWCYCRKRQVNFEAFSIAGFHTMWKQTWAWKTSEDVQSMDAVRAEQQGNSCLYLSNKSPCWSASYSQASGRFASPQLHQQITSDDQRAVHSASLNTFYAAFSMKRPDH